jgi:aminoglycoside/choline kinase family phosphotransferase
LNEANLFTNWYVPKVITKNKVNTIKKQLNKIYIKLLLNLKLKNSIFVHRDFHVSNLMKVNKNIAVIDAQDALYGNMAYDLASLIDDVRFKTTNKLKEKIFLEFIRSNTKVDRNKFKNDFEILSILRNLKIIGIFTRLSIRDKKHNYLKLIPHAWKLIEYRINKNNEFKELKFVLDKYFPKKIRQLK